MPRGHDDVQNGALTAEPDRRRQLRVTAYTGGVLLFVVAAFYSYTFFTQRAQLAGLSRPRPPTPIEAAVASLESVAPSISGIGTLQAVHQVTVAPEVGGRIVQIFFEPGATVKAGDPLVQLYDAPLRGELANYQAQLRLGTVNLQRTKELNERQFQSRQTVDQQQSALDQIKANVAKTEAQISQMLIRAPFAGQLGVRQVNVGAVVNPGAPIVTLTDLSQLWANFTLAEQAASQVSVGQTAKVHIDAFPGQVFDAKITAIEPQISAQTRTLLVQATLDNARHALLPGMFANVEVELAAGPDVVTVPETSVDYSLYGEAVYVLKEDGVDDKGNPVVKAMRTVVKTGERFNGKVVILSGLKGGERVAASGQLKLNNGAPVAIKAGNSLTGHPDTSKY